MREFLSRFRLPAVGIATVTLASALVVGAPSTAGAATSCSSVEIDFARGTFEAPGLGSVGTPFVSSLTSDLAGKTVSSYALVYDANADQSSAGPGSTVLVQHIESVLASCPSTKFVLGGYSQGATVVDKVLGISTLTGGTGTALPSSLASKIKAAVVFGNPLGLQGETIEKNSSVYGARAKSFCNFGDPICGAGINIIAHFAYAWDGSAPAGATFAAAKVNS